MYSFDVVIFDLDGVVTKTALVHSAAWKKVIDGYLKEREKISGLKKDNVIELKRGLQ